MCRQDFLDLWSRLIGHEDTHMEYIFARLVHIWKAAPFYVARESDCGGIYTVWGHFFNELAALLSDKFLFRQFRQVIEHIRLPCHQTWKQCQLLRKSDDLSHCKVAVNCSLYSKYTRHKTTKQIQSKQPNKYKAKQTKQTETKIETISTTTTTTTSSTKTDG